MFFKFYFKVKTDPSLEETKEHFSHLPLNGTLFDRAECVIKFIQRNTHNYVCFAREKNVRLSLSCYVDGDYCNFSNNGVEFCLAKLHKLKPIENFASKVRLAIDLAEKMGGSLNEKLNSFTQTFPGNVNVIVSEGKQFDVCLRYNWDCYLKEYRGVTKYMAWLCGHELNADAKE